MSILNTLKVYRQYRRQRLTNAWWLAGMPNVMDKLVGAAIKIGFVVMCLYLMSDYANSAAATARLDQAATVERQNAEMSAMKRIIAACMGDKEGALYIGDELHLCRAVPIGIKR